MWCLCAGKTTGVRVLNSEGITEIHFFPSKFPILPLQYVKPQTQLIPNQTISLVFCEERWKMLLLFLFLNNLELFEVCSSIELYKTHKILITLDFHI